MSIVDDQVRRLDAALDRIQLLAAESDTSIAEADIDDAASPIAVSKTDNTTVIKIKSVSSHPAAVKLSSTSVLQVSTNSFSCNV